MSKKKILVVDDEKLIVKGIRFSLEQDDMEVDCAYDGEEALQYAKNCEYDLVLLDVMLPKMDGFQVCQAIREFSDMPIVMLTAKSEDMDKILGLEYGADDYITKPFNILEVKARIKAIMRRTARKEESAQMVKINGEEKAIAGKNLLEYLKEAGFEPERVVVERNFEIIPKDQLGNVTIQDEDEIEVLRFVGGG